MKSHILFLLIFLLFSSCKDAGIEITDTDRKVMTALSNYFAANVTIKKGFFRPLNGGAVEGNYKILLQSTDLKAYYPNAAVPASYCAWYCYTQLSESDRQFFNQYSVEVPFDHDVKSFDYSAADLALVWQAMPQLDSVFAYFSRGDYPSMREKFLPEVQKNARLAQFFSTIKSLDLKYGKSSEMKVRGFQILEFAKDSSSENREYLVQFQVLQIREKTKLKLLATVSPHTLYGFIGGLDFE